MKKSLLIKLFALVAALMCALGMQAAEAYVCYTSSNETLTFYYDNLRSTRTDTYDLNEGSNVPGWNYLARYYNRVVFDPSFASARPTTTYRWFSSMYNLETITGLNYLNTSQVTNMAYMFDCCYRLTSLDLSTFNTSRVTDMSNMFYWCDSLASLNVSNWNTSKVTSMYEMFYWCSSLTSLNVSNWNTANVTTMYQMFRGCSGLRSLDLSNFNTSRVSNMEEMFDSCYGLTSLNVSNFNTDSVYSMRSMFFKCESLTSLDLSSFTSARFSNTNRDFMFENCTNLKTIYAGEEDWFAHSTTWMFDNCPNLVGGMGTTYDASHTNGDYARLDRGAYYHGYFTRKGYFYDNGICCRITGNNTVEVSSQGEQGYSGDVVIPSTVSHDGKTYRVTAIGDKAFKGCSDLTGVTIPNSVTSIGNEAFSHCGSSFTSVTIPNSVLTIGNDAFASCYLSGTLTIPNSVTSIGEDAFTECEFTKLILGSGLTTVGACFIDRCYDLDTLICMATVPPALGGIDHDGVIERQATLFVPPSSLAAYQAHSVWGQFHSIMAWSHFEEGGIYYRITSDSKSASTVEVTYKDANYNSYSGDVTIPPTVSHDGVTYTVTAIGDNAFRECSGLTGVTIPETVTRIGDEAFYLCGTSFTSVTIPNSVLTIGDGAFERSYLSGSLTIPNSVTSIGEYAFIECNITELTLGSGLTQVGDLFIDRCCDLRKVTCLAMVPPALDRIDHSGDIVSQAKLFVPYSSLAAYQAHSGWSGFSTIHRLWYDFMMADGTYYRINGEGTVSMVYGYNLHGDVIIPESVTYNGTTYQVTAIGAEAFQENTGLLSVVIPNTVTVIDDGAFNCCEGLTSVTMGNSVTYIGEAAFMDCISLTSVTIPNSVTTISEQAFSGCEAMTSVTMGNSVTNIHTGAFGCCSSLTSVTCLATTPPSMDSDDTFDADTYANATLTVPAGSLNLYQTAFGWSFFTHIVTDGVLPPEVYACYTPSDSTLTFYYDNQRSTRTGTTYDLNEGSSDPGWFTDGNYANVTQVVFNPLFAYARPTTTYSWFFDMQELQSITGIEYLNTSEVTSMAWMFSGCSVLTGLNLNGFNTSNVIDMSGMFEDCYGLTSLDLSRFNTANVENMSDMFHGCEGLTSLDVSNFNTAKVTTMVGMFRSCANLTSLDLSTFNTARVTDMSSMFSDCCDLTTIYVNGGWTTGAVMTSSDGMFWRCYNLVGGQGTTYNASHIDKAYARIDGGTANPGYLTAKAEMGDANSDGEIDITDVTLLINAVLTGNLADINEANVDCNDDGIIDITDVTMLISRVLTGAW